MTLTTRCRRCGALTDDGGLCLDCEVELADARDTLDAINRGEIDETEAERWPWAGEAATERTL